MRMDSRLISCISIALIAGLACTPTDVSRTNRDNGSSRLRTELVVARSQVDSLQREITGLRRDGAERDSALDLVRETQELLDNIDRELSTIPGVEERRLKVGTRDENTDVDMPAGINRKIARAKELMERSDAAVERLQARLAQLAAKGSSNGGEAEQLRSSLATMAALVDGQRKEIERANQRVAQVESENQALTQQIAVISDTLSAVRTREHTVYMVAGSEKELLDAGVVTREGGTKILFWKPGQTLVPSHDAPRSAFRALDMMRDRVIDLPADGAAYRIVSKHSPALLVDSEGDLVRNRLEIRDPERFWEASRFLILVRK